MDIIGDDVGMGECKLMWVLRTVSPHARSEILNFIISHVTQSTASTFCRTNFGRLTMNGWKVTSKDNHTFDTY